MSLPSTPATSPSSPDDGCRPSPAPGSDGPSARAADDACLWCKAPLPPSTSRGRRRYCSQNCRQAAWRARRLAVVEGLGDAPKRLIYADPPFPGLAHRYYGDQPTYAGEVDHRRLVEQLMAYDGWALSTSAEALRDVLPLCPREAIHCPWTKSHHPARARGPSNIHEYVIVVPARWRFPGVPDALYAGCPRGAGLIGAKPIKFVMWLFALLGAAPHDSLVDLFPGTELAHGNTPHARVDRGGWLRCGRLHLLGAGAPVEDEAMSEHDETEVQRLREDKEWALRERDVSRRRAEVAECLVATLRASTEQTERELANAKRDRDEAQRMLIDWEWERCGWGHEAAGTTKRMMADNQFGDGAGARLFPEEKS